MVQKILAIPLPMNPIEDKFVWSSFENGKFSIKSAYLVAS